MAIIQKAKLIAGVLLFLIFVPTLSHAQNVKTTTNTDGLITVDGKPFFLLGIDELNGLVDNPSAGISWSEFTAAGLNYVHYDNDGDALLHNEPAGVMRGVNLGQWWLSTTDLTSAVNHWTSIRSANQIIWQWLDEPTWQGNHCDDITQKYWGANNTQYFMTTNRSLQPLLWVNFVSSAAYEAQPSRDSLARQSSCAKNITANVVSSDFYPFMSNASAPQSDMQRVLKDVDNWNKFSVTNSTTNITYLQGLGDWWNCNYYVTPVTCSPISGRYPTLVETRFMAYGAIVKGAKGIMWWGPPWTRNKYLYNPSAGGMTAWKTIEWQNNFMQKIAPIIKELRQKQIYQAITGTKRINIIADSPLLALQTEDALNWYIIAINNSATAQMVKHVNVPVANKTISVLAENRTLITNPSETLTDSFAAWGDHVYQISKTSFPNPADVNNNNVVDTNDLKQILTFYGTTGNQTRTDLNSDGKISALDAGYWFGSY